MPYIAERSTTTGRSGYRLGTVFCKVFAKFLQHFCNFFLKAQQGRRRALAESLCCLPSVTHHADSTQTYPLWRSPHATMLDYPLRSRRRKGPVSRR